MFVGREGEITSFLGSRASVVKLQLSGHSTNIHHCIYSNFQRDIENMETHEGSIFPQRFLHTTTSKHPSHDLQYLL